MNLYLAAPLFSEAERAFNTVLATALGARHTVFLPQRDGHLIEDLVKAGADEASAAQSAFDVDVAAIRRSDCIVAVLDGRGVDEGVAVELGIAFAISKASVGLQTDRRRLLGTRNNPMVDCILWDVRTTIAELLVWLDDPRRR